MDDNPLGNQPIPDAAKFAVGAQPQGQPQQAQAPQAAAQGAPQGGQPPAANMAQNLQDADTQHHSILGKAFRSIMGNDVSYQINPQTGKMEQQEVPQKPGQLWRGILAATILGGATAAKNKAPGFAQGAAEGGGAVLQHGEEQDQQKRAQAQQQFKDQLTAKSANTEEDLKRAQIAMHNAQTLHENKLMQQQDYVFHKEIAESGKKSLQPFIDADPTSLKFQDVPETQMNDIIKNNPSAGNLLWEHTGTKIVLDKDGNPNHISTLSAVDPNGNVKVTNDQIEQWKKSGVDQTYGKATWDVLKKDKELPMSTYMAINQKSKELANGQTLTKKAKFDEEKESAAINLSKAEATHFKAEASKLYSDENDKKAANEAFDILSSGKDIAKISIKGRKLLTDTIDGTIKTSVDELKALPKGLDGQVVDQDQAKDIYGTIEKYQKIRDRLYGIKEPAAAGGAQPGGAPKVPSLDKDSQDYVNTRLNDKQGKAIYNKDMAGGIIWNEQDLSDDQKIAVTANYDAMVPWSAVAGIAKQRKTTPEAVADYLKKANIRVQSAPVPAQKFASSPSSDEETTQQD